MSNLELTYKTDCNVNVTVTDANGDAVTGATVTITIMDKTGETALYEDEVMSAEGGGVYSFTFPAEAAVSAGDVLRGQISVDTGSLEGYAEPYLVVVVDRS